MDDKTKVDEMNEHATRTEEFVPPEAAAGKIAAQFAFDEGVTVGMRHEAKYVTDLLKLLDAPVTVLNVMKAQMLLAAHDVTEFSADEFPRQVSVKVTTTDDGKQVIEQTVAQNADDTGDEPKSVDPVDENFQKAPFGFVEPPKSKPNKPLFEPENAS